MLIFIMLNVGLLLYVITIFRISPSYCFNNTNNGKQSTLSSDVSNTSCFDRCGEGSSSMCSCDLTCAVEETCCEDYFEACFKPYDLRLALFYKLSSLVEECKYDVYPIVSQCPPESGNRQKIQFDTSGDFPQKSLNITNGTHPLVQLFLQVPVTDLETGFTFKNISIYQCHKMSEKESLFWNVYMDNVGFQRDGEWQFNVLSALRFQVFPPTVKQDEIIFKCTEKMNLYYKTAPFEKYEQFVNSEFESLVDRLIHGCCKVCSATNETVDMDETKELENVLRVYPVLTSYTPLTNTFNLHVSPSYKGFQNILWKSMTCSNINTEPNKDSLVCRIDECLDQVWRTERGQCKYLHVLKLAVLEEEQLISTIFVNQLTFYVQCYLTLYAGYEIVNMWNDTKVVYSPRFEKVLYLTDYIVLFDYRLDIFNDDKEMLLHFIHYAKLIQYLSGIRAAMATKDLQSSPDLRYINFLKLPDLENMYLIHNYFTGPAINTLNGTKRQILPVCANLSPIISDQITNLPEIEPLCVYVSKTDVVADVKTTEINSCLDMFKYSSQRSNHLSGMFTNVIRLLSLIIMNHICMNEII